MKLSIITINLNNVDGLKKTIESVFQQTFKAFEYIIIDGGSTDGSKELIEQYKDRLSYCVSEKDAGIYNAMNKGILHSTGEYVMVLNSGDWFYSPTVLEALVTTSAGEDIVYGDILHVLNGVRKPIIFPDRLTFGFFLTGFNSLPHAGTMIKRHLFTTISLYNEAYKIVSDFEFFIVALNKYNVSYRRVPGIVVEFNLEGISAQKKYEPLLIEERTAVLAQHFPMFLPDYENMDQMRSQIQQIQKSFGYRLHRKFQSIIQRFTTS